MPDVFIKLRKFEKVYNFVYSVFMLICKLLLVADILITSWIVLARYIKVIPAPNWGEELILTLMSYMAVLSAALAIKRNAHIRMTAFDRYLPEKVIVTLDLIADLAVLALAVVMLTTGWSYATGLGAKGTFISMPWLSKFWQYFPIPLAGLAMIFFEIERIVLDIERYFIREEEIPDHGVPSLPDRVFGSDFHTPVPVLHGTAAGNTYPADGQRYQFFLTDGSTFLHHHGRPDGLGRYI